VTFAGLLCAGVLASRCTSKPAAQAELQAVVSIKELMENIVDPISDNIFDAVGTDISAKGIVETMPTTDDDWAKVRIGAVTLAEASNLLKIPRAAAPAGAADTRGPNAPELSPEQVLAKINQDRALWNKHADELRNVAIETMAIVKAKNAGALFDVGGKLDKVCENCHLEYWYPGDKKAVLEDELKRATMPSKKK
jgi:formate-dependent nitrite reductase cytochrome c552 subunit